MDDPNKTLLDDVPPSVETFAARVQFLAKVLAYGVFKDNWTGRIAATPSKTSDGIISEDWQDLGYGDYNRRLAQYLKRVWGEAHPRASFLEIYGYLERKGSQNSSVEYILTPKALALLDVPRFKKLFISYRRQESSAFALLLHDRLAQALFDPFIDLRGIDPGEKFQDRINEEIDASEVFVCLVGQTTLGSKYVMAEIDYALSKGMFAVPIWHNNFVYKKGRFRGARNSFFSKTNAIVVDPENVNGYENAFRELIQFLQRPEAKT